MRIYLIIVGLLCSGIAFSQENSLIGKNAPELIFEKILNYEKNTAKLSDFKDKILIIDFWSVWCAPCIASFPHLQELQEHFQNEIQVLTITSNTEERIEQFLKNKPMLLPIVLDLSGELAKSFPHGSIPHTVLIDKEGTIRVITSPNNITMELVSSILSGEEVNVEEKRDVKNFDPSLPLSGNDNLSYQITMTPYNPNFLTYSYSGGGDGPYAGRRILVTNLAARALFEIAFQFPPRIRTIVEVKDVSKFEWSKQNAICFDLIVPEEMGEQRFEIMKEQLSRYYGYRATVEERLMPVKVLQRIKGTDILITESKEGTESYAKASQKGLSVKGSAIKELALFLEDHIHMPVVNETNLAGLYDLEITWYNEKPEQVNEDLKKLGLELIDAERKIEVLVIRDK
jgi:thiol-disulfide isomerase/thioredoxin